MFKTLIVATCLAVGAGAAAFAAPVFVEAQESETAIHTSIALNRLAANRLASNRLAANKLAANKLAANKLAANKLAANRLATNKLAANRLAANGVSLDAVTFAPTSPGDVTPLVTIVAVTLGDGTRMELPAAR